MKNLQTEVKTVKEDTKTYKQSLGAVKPGKLVSVPEIFALGIRIRSIPEKHAENASADERLYADIAEVEAIHEFLNIENRKLVKAQRLGKHNRNKTFPRTLLINNENPISRDLILRAAIKLKGYNKYENAVYISPQLNSTDAKKQNESLKKRRELMESSKKQTILQESSENKLSKRPIS